MDSARHLSSPSPTSPFLFHHSERCKSASLTPLLSSTAEVTSADDYFTSAATHLSSFIHGNETITQLNGHHHLNGLNLNHMNLNISLNGQHRSSNRHSSCVIDDNDDHSLGDSVDGRGSNHDRVGSNGGAGDVSNATAQDANDTDADDVDRIHNIILSSGSSSSSVVDSEGTHLLANVVDVEGHQNHHSKHDHFISRISLDEYCDSPLGLDCVGSLAEISPTTPSSLLIPRDSCHGGVSVNTSTIQHNNKINLNLNGLIHKRQNNVNSEDVDLDLGHEHDERSCVDSSSTTNSHSGHTTGSLSPTLLTTPVSSLMSSLASHHTHHWHTNHANTHAHTNNSHVYAIKTNSEPPLGGDRFGICSFLSSTSQQTTNLFRDFSASSSSSTSSFLDHGRPSSEPPNLQLSPTSSISSTCHLGSISLDLAQSISTINNPTLTSSLNDFQPNSSFMSSIVPESSGIVENSKQNVHKQQIDILKGQCGMTDASQSGGQPRRQRHRQARRIAVRSRSFQSPSPPKIPPSPPSKTHSQLHLQLKHHKKLQELQMRLFGSHPSEKECDNAQLHQLRQEFAQDSNADMNICVSLSQNSESNSECPNEEIECNAKPIITRSSVTRLSGNCGYRSRSLRQQSQLSKNLQRSQEQSESQTHDKSEGQEILLKVSVDATDIRNTNSDVGLAESNNQSDQGRQMQQIRTQIRSRARRTIVTSGLRSNKINPNLASDHMTITKTGNGVTAFKTADLANTNLFNSNNGNNFQGGQADESEPSQQNHVFVKSSGFVKASSNSLKNQPYKPSFAQSLTSPILDNSSGSGIIAGASSVGFIMPNSSHCNSTKIEASGNASSCEKGEVQNQAIKQEVKTFTVNSAATSLGIAPQILAQANQNHSFNIQNQGQSDIQLNKIQNQSDFLQQNKLTSQSVNVQCGSSSLAALQQQHSLSGRQIAIQVICQDGTSLVLPVSSAPGLAESLAAAGQLNLNPTAQFLSPNSTNSSTNLASSVTSNPTSSTASSSAINISVNKATKTMKNIPPSASPAGTNELINQSDSILSPLNVSHHQSSGGNHVVSGLAASSPTLAALLDGTANHLCTSDHNHQRERDPRKNSTLNPGLSSIKNFATKEVPGSSRTNRNGNSSGQNSVNFHFNVGSTGANNTIGMNSSSNKSLQNTSGDVFIEQQQLNANSGVQLSDSNNNQIGLQVEVESMKQINPSSSVSGSSTHPDNTANSANGCVESVTQPFRCEHCNSTFTRLGNFTRHKKIHTMPPKQDGQRFKCDACSKSFLQRCDLARHLHIHRGTEPHRCNICGKGYIRHSDLVTHQRFHNKEKPFGCPHCNKGFCQRGDLNRHLRSIHLQLKPILCPFCNRKFAKQETLLRHLNTSHRCKNSTGPSGQSGSGVPGLNQPITTTTITSNASGISIVTTPVVTAQTTSDLNNNQQIAHSAPTLASALTSAATQPSGEISNVTSNETNIMENGSGLMSMMSLESFQPPQNMQNQQLQT